MCHGVFSLAIDETRVWDSVVRERGSRVANMDTQCVCTRVHSVWEETPVSSGLRQRIWSLGERKDLLTWDSWCEDCLGRGCLERFNVQSCYYYSRYYLRCSLFVFNKSLPSTNKQDFSSSKEIYNTEPKVSFRLYFLKESIKI